MSTTDARSRAAGAELQPEFRVWMPVDPLSVSIARSIARRVVTFRDDDAESSYLIALSEIVANAVDEHERAGIDDEIMLVGRGGPGGGFTVSDRGRGIGDPDVDAAGSVTVPETSDRGRGLAIARAFVPSIEFHVDVNGTTVSVPFERLGVLS